MRVFNNPNGVIVMENDDLDLNNLSPEMQAELNAYYDWLELISGEQHDIPEDWTLEPTG